jgi:signal peptidase II
MPKRYSYIKNFAWLLMAAVIIVLDQVTKFLIAHFLLVEEVVSVTSFFNLYFTFNTGAAFSFLADANGWQEWLFGGLALLISLAIISWLFRTKKAKAWTKFSFMLILGGAVGNLIDRVLYGHVRDFLYFHWHDLLRWPAFNLADSAICLGAILLILEMFLYGKKRPL